MKIFNVLKEQKNRAVANSQYLKKGLYFLHSNLHTYIRNEKGGKFQHLPKHKRDFRNTILLILGRALYSIRVKKDGSFFSGDAMYFSSILNPKYQDIKVFDYENELVLTRCPSKIRYDLFMKNYEKFIDKFPMPELIEKNEDSLFYVEKLISSDKSKQEVLKQKEFYHNLFKIYKEYYKKTQMEKFDEALLKCDHAEDIIFAEEVLGALQHGDLSSDNLVIDKEQKIFFIDFDHAKNFPLFYDVFFLMFNEAIMKNNRQGIDFFADGEFDKYFDGKKHLYLKSFITTFYNIRLKGIANERITKQYLCLYKEIYNKTEEKC